MRPEVLTAIANAGKKKGKKKLHFPKPVKRCSGSFHPPPLPQLALGSIQVVERKTGTLKRK